MPRPASWPRPPRLVRLEWLAHTLGHELLHAVVANCCPARVAGSGWMRATGGHGPVFQQLNRHLLGHGAAYKCAAGWAKGGRRYVLRGAGAGGGRERSA